MKKLSLLILAFSACISSAWADTTVTVTHAEVPAATCQQWEDFADILAQGLCQEAAICQIAEQYGWMV